MHVCGLGLLAKSFAFQKPVTNPLCWGWRHLVRFVKKVVCCLPPLHKNEKQQRDTGSTILCYCHLERESLHKQPNWRNCLLRPPNAHMYKYQRISEWICYINMTWPALMSLSAATTRSTCPLSEIFWKMLPSRRSHRVMTSSEWDKMKGSKAAKTEPEIFHLLPAWWLCSCSKLIVVKPVNKNS